MTIRPDSLPRFIRTRLGTWCLALTLIVAAALYLRLHAALVASPWPLTVREAAFILQTEAILDPSAPSQYSAESVPDNVNLYGPLYPLFAAPFVALVPGDPYVSHRLATMLCLILTCLILGWSIGKNAGRLAGCTAAVFFYCATVATPSIAAGPDNLAVLLYVTALVWVWLMGCGFPGLVGGALLGFLALMAKPYAVWILPCLLVYVAWRHSVARGVVFGIFLLGAGAVWIWGANRLWPEYFFSVFSIHAGAASRHFETFRLQLVEFSYLSFAPILLLCFCAPWRRVWQAAVCWRWKNPPAHTDHDHTWVWPLFMTAGAAAPILLSMGWHVGAHLIYYNHLLLAPLLLATFSPARLAIPEVASTRWAHTLAAGNILLFLILLPSMPPSPFRLPLPPGGPVLVDPVLEPLRRTQIKADVVDNGQTEYWIHAAKKSASPERRERALAWEQALRNKIKSGHYQTIVLISPEFYDRRPIFEPESKTPSPDLIKNYSVIDAQNLNFYYLPFRSRSEYGHMTAQALVLHRIVPATSTALPAP